MVSSYPLNHTCFARGGCAAVDLLPSAPWVGKGWGMSSFGVAKPFGLGNEGLLENLHPFRIFGFPDVTCNETLSFGEITAQFGCA